MAKSAPHLPGKTPPRAPGLRRPHRLSSTPTVVTRHSTSDPHTVASPPPVCGSLRALAVPRPPPADAPEINVPRPAAASTEIRAPQGRSLCSAPATVPGKFSEQTPSGFGLKPASWLLGRCVFLEGLSTRQRPLCGRGLGEGDCALDGLIYFLSRSTKQNAPPGREPVCPPRLWALPLQVLPWPSEQPSAPPPNSGLSVFP